MRTTRTRLLAAIACLSVASCGGGGGGSGSGSNSGGSNPPRPPASSVSLASDTGDFIGQGQSYSYSNANALITLEVNEAHLTLRIEGDESWRGEFVLPNMYTTLTAGTYNNLTRYPFHDSVLGGMEWSGEHRGCNQLTGTLVIESVTYSGSTLTAIDLTFEQFCENGSTAMRGDVHWDANDTTSPPGPVVPPPAGLWEPSPGSTPATGNYVYLDSQPGDFVGQGGSYTYTPADSQITINAAGGHLSVSINGNLRWTGDFQAMNSVSQLEGGYYSGLKRYPFHSPVKGGLNWDGEGRGCNTLTGWFVIDSVTYDGATLTAIDLRFEQHCEGNTSALNGEIHWDVNDATSPPGPVVPPPAGLWEPAPGNTPVAGNYVYLESELGDYIGSGSSYTYTPFDSQITIDSPSGRLSVSIDGDEYWNGDFQAMNSLNRLEVGYYGDLRGYPFHNPATGGLDWSGEGRGCNTLTGWFVVDSVTYAGTTLMAIELRFEQHCEGGAPALHGVVRWDTNDTTTAPGPEDPPPADLWAPASGVTPTSGNYVYLESEPGDFIGAGGSYTHTKADSITAINTVEAIFSVSIRGSENWSGGFQAMHSLSQLEVGYYGDLQRFGFHNPAKGGLNWESEGRSCNTVSGWFVVDNVVYAGATLLAIDLRFEQHCNGNAPALHGEIHWDANDATGPPGPVVPPPAGLWEPAPGITPATGNYVYFESEPGDRIGRGVSYTYTQADSQIALDTTGALLRIEIAGNERWGGRVQGTNTQSLLEVGFYGDLQRYPFHDPARGGLDWNAQSRGCNTLIGWFVVDSVTYDGTTLMSIDLRFEQHCEGDWPALHGEIHWDANDATSPPGPVVPPPASLWEPAQGVTPATGNYVYLESQPADRIGLGETYTYTPVDSQTTVNAAGGRLSISIRGQETWNGDFETMNTLSQLEVGYYGNLKRFPFHNPAVGGLSWSGEGRGCNGLTGWFVVDNVTYDGTTLTAIDLRFEQYCGNSIDPLNGEIRWNQQ